MKITTCVLAVLAVAAAHSSSATRHVGGFAPPPPMSPASRAPAMLRGRSAPSRPVGEVPKLRMELGGFHDLPKDCGIDPVTGEICAGDPSLILTTNVKLGTGKKEFMAAASKAVAKGLGKPESYVAVCVNDGADMLFGGNDAPCALACCYSLGAINQQNNKAVTAAVTALLEQYNVPANRMYINFFDVPAANIGYNGATFAG